ncbi:uncharacterized protein TM35_000231030 [Trypanosoma theileri]|uniref:Uncharacterized protein n=1 Tax=Trypanosoma theileri TaxID=67003 RepID=A0A1X0NQZ3_9TRYP|nr:uncharacterized protein TM35_000231030 [Trypanosoma theileri]ORC87132.1 hypothetical protein TM35_000231030 [Trypanosoma theileri]
MSTGTVSKNTVTLSVHAYCKFAHGSKPFAVMRAIALSSFIGFPRARQNVSNCPGNESLCCHIDGVPHLARVGVCYPRIFFPNGRCRRFAVPKRNATGEQCGTPGHSIKRCRTHSKMQTGPCGPSKQTVGDPVNRGCASPHSPTAGGCPSKVF